MPVVETGEGRLLTTCPWVQLLDSRGLSSAKKIARRVLSPGNLRGFLGNYACPHVVVPVPPTNLDDAACEIVVSPATIPRIGALVLESQLTFHFWPFDK